MLLAIGVLDQQAQRLAVATDQSAAPGLLAETGIAAAQLAIDHLAGNPRGLPGSGDRSD